MDICKDNCKDICKDICMDILFVRIFYSFNAASGSWLTIPSRSLSVYLSD